MASVDFFLKIEGIDGESQDSKHKGEIHIESWSWGEAQTGTHSAGGGGGAGKVAMQDIHFTTKVNKSSPKLMLACADGSHIKKAVLTARKAGKEQQDYLQITFSDLLISSYQIGGSTEIPVDQFAINFTKIEYEYKEQKTDGSLGAGVKVQYNLKEMSSK